MCEPTTLAIATFAITAGGAVADHVAQKKLSKATAEAANESLKDTLTDLGYRQVQEQDAASLSIFQIERQLRQQKSLAAVSAGEAGVAGLSVDALLGDMDREGLEAIGTTERNLDMTLTQLDRDKAAGRTEALNRIASAPAPNPFATGLRIAGAGLDLGNTLTRKPRSK